MAGDLYLIPTGLGSGDPLTLLPPATSGVVVKLRHFIVEDAKSARAFLKSIGYPHSLQGASFLILNEHTRESEISSLLAPLESGESCGLLSEAGCPAVADPGAALVREAHTRGIRVIPLVGPSSLLLALMASGLNGQRFCFHGYLPVESAPRAKRIAELEAASRREDATQIFIEAPYRNQSLLQAILAACRPDTLLCIAADITLRGEEISTRTISAWRQRPPQLQRRPAVFLLYRRPK